jgi:hypothetical protein
MDYFLRLIEVSERLPRWLQPVFWGSLLLPFLMVVKMGGKWGIPIFVVLFVVVYGWWGVPIFFGLFVLVAAAGTAGGVAYSLLSPLRALGGLGSWLRWSAGLGVYLCVVILVVGAAGIYQRVSLTDPAGRAALLTVSLVFGGIAAWITRDEDMRGA